MALKIIGFIFVTSLVFGIPTPTPVKDVPFNVNEVIERVNSHQQGKSRIQSPKSQNPNSAFRIPKPVNS